MSWMASFSSEGQSHPLYKTCFRLYPPSSVVIFKASTQSSADVFFSSALAVPLVSLRLLNIDSTTTTHHSASSIQFHLQIYSFTHFFVHRHAFITASTLGTHDHLTIRIAPPYARILDVRHVRAAQRQNEVQYTLHGSYIIQFACFGLSVTNFPAPPSQLN